MMVRLRALDAEDLQVVSALVQDAVVPGSEMRCDRKGRRFAALLNRFRWESAGREAERVRAMLDQLDLHIAFALVLLLPV